MSTSTPLSLRAALGTGLRGAMRWRLWLVWTLATLACALLAAIPAWGWLAGALNHSVDAAAIAAGKAPTKLLDAVMAQPSPLPVISESVMVGAILTLLLSPFLAGATVAAARSPARLGFGDLLRGGIGEYGPMLRMLLWSAIPLGLAVVVGTAVIGANEAAHEHAVMAADVATGRNIGLAIAALLFVLASASLDAGRGWIAADGRLRSALKAWWRGLKLLLRRPLAVLGTWVATTLLGLVLAAVFAWLRGMVSPAGFGGFLLALLLGCGIAASLAWGRIARLYGMRALAADAHARR